MYKPTQMYKEDCLIIGFDWNFPKDEAALTVMRKEGETIKVINSFTNKEAVDLYYKLIDKR